MLPPSLSTTRRISASLRCPGPRQRVFAVPETASARLAVHRVLAVLGAELLQLEPVGVVPPVLARDVVPVLALLAGQGDLRTDVGGCHGSAPSLVGPRPWWAGTH